MLFSSLNDHVNAIRDGMNIQIGANIVANEGSKSNDNLLYPVAGNCIIPAWLSYFWLDKNML